MSIREAFPGKVDPTTRNRCISSGDRLPASWSMRKVRFLAILHLSKEEQIAFALRQAESGTAVTEITRKLGVSEQTF